jgi:hypothetical protein
VTGCDQRAAEAKDGRGVTDRYTQGFAPSRADENRTDRHCFFGRRTITHSVNLANLKAQQRCGDCSRREIALSNVKLIIPTTTIRGIQNGLSNFQSLQAACEQGSWVE